MSIFFVMFFKPLLVNLFPPPHYSLFLTVRPSFSCCLVFLNSPSLALTSHSLCDDSSLPVEQLCSPAKPKTKWQSWHHEVVGKRPGLSHSASSLYRRRKQTSVCTYNFVSTDYVCGFLTPLPSVFLPFLLVMISVTVLLCYFFFNAYISTHFLCTQLYTTVVCYVAFVVK